MFFSFPKTKPQAGEKNRHLLEDTLRRDMPNIGFHATCIMAEITPVWLVSKLSQKLTSLCA